MKQATDLLQEILQKVSIIEKELSTNNFLLKTLLAKSSQEEKPIAKKPPMMQVTAPITIQPVEPVIEKKPEVKVIAGKTEPVSNNFSEEKFAVMQIITKEEKSVFMANITITNSQGVECFTGTTNPNGMWNAALPAGEYNISIRKNAGTKSTPIDITDSFTVGASKVKSGKIILQPLKL